ncbi:hypothetical protein TRICI_003233 [Trichomonascus ciferrii]|uniref:Presequence protease, mitochondrial n=1 Tax=Trichomonascus ciferrii TaxID=44093 RepID=A0A642V3Q0_9ASCO|nr:hypothetical protein TRICI_003233 [Trichomonascus ciferrii]
MLRSVHRLKRGGVASSLRWMHSASKGYKVGDEVSGYKVQNVLHVPRLDMTALDLVEPLTEARHIHIGRDDPNKVFTVGFKTNPPDLSGLPHILEHTTLCGSEKFPVKDPFFAMLTRSLANFMNAMTGLDYTFYPFSTTNKTDFKNLQSVYLDSVYHPLLRETDFKQEGWRLEKDEKDELIFKGVVYNEMKGMVSDPAYFFHERHLRSIYPSLQSSGGDPAYITDLKWKDLKEFHESRYHPSNSISFTYGDMDLKEVLAPIYNVVKGFKKQEFKLGVRQPLEFEQNQKCQVKGPFDPLFDESRQHKMSLSWVVADSNDLDTVALWKVLSLLLMSGHSSPFYKALIDGGVGTDFTVNSGLDDLPGKSIFSIGLQGLSDDNLELFKKTVFDVLKDIAQNGIPQDRVQAIINQVELSYREVEANYGLNMISKIIPRVFNDTDVFGLIDDEKLLTSFKNTLERNPNVFKQKVTELLEKPYFEFLMEPTESYETDMVKEEETRLANKIGGLNETERAEANTPMPEKEEGDLTVLPTLTTNDISPEITPIEVKKEKINSVNLFVRETGTRGVSYIQILKNLCNLPAELRPYLPLYTSALTNVGTSDHSMSELENLIRLNTGSVDVSVAVRNSHGNSPELNLALGGSGLEEKTPFIYEYLDQFLFKAQLDNVEKLRPLIQGSAASLMSELSQSGHSYARRHAAAGILPKRRLDESLSGIEQVQLVKDTAALDEDQLREQLVPKLKAINEYAIGAAPIDAGLTFSPNPDNLPTNKKHLSDLVGKFTPSPSSTSTLDISPLGNQNTLFQLPFAVSYAGVALKGADYGHPDSAALRILSSILTHKYLHPEIREKGGAYGGGAVYSGLDGILEFFSYRDPNPVNTIAVIQKSGEWAAMRDFTQQELLSAKLNAFQGLDAPIPPRSEITYELMYGLTNEMRQKKREDILAVTLDDVKRVAQQYLIPALSNFQSANATVLGPAQKDFSQNDWNLVEIN